MLKRALLSLFLLLIAPAFANAQQQGQSLGAPQPLSCSMVVNACGTQGFTRSALGSFAFTNGTATPSAAGFVGDYYLQTSTGQLWQYGATGWAVVTKLAGSNWWSGSGAPSSTVGINGDFDYRTDTAQIYQKAAGAWSVTTSLAALGLANSWSGTQVWKGYFDSTIAASIVSGALTLDASQGSWFVATSNANITSLSVINVPTGTVANVNLILVGNGTAYTQTWGSNPVWPGGLPPVVTTTSGKRDWYSCSNPDGSTTFVCVIVAQSY